MKFKHFIPMMALALPFVASAVPAKPGIHQTKTPDGKTINVQCFGDEHFSYYTDAEGKKLYEMTKEGFMVPMVRNGVALEASESTIKTLYDEAMKGNNLAPTQALGKFKRASLDFEGRTTFPSKGKQKGLVILVEFADRKFVIPDVKNQFKKMLNQEGYSDYNGLGSAADYYKQSSDNQYFPEFDVFGPYTLSEEAGYYTGYDMVGKLNVESVGKYYRMNELVKEATEGLDKEINFADYDADNDGIIDFVFFFFAGHGQADYYGEYGIYEYPKQTCIWPHASSYSGSLTLDNKILNSYACSMELDGGLSRKTNRVMTGIGTFCHEFGHVIGLPDLYDVSGYGTANPDNYSVMASASYSMNSTCPLSFSAYERWLCNWLEYNDLDEATHVEIDPLCSTVTTDKFGKPDERTRRLRLKFQNGDNVQLRPNEYFVIENRTKMGFDRSIPQEGMLFWHIDYVSGRWSGNSVNTNRTSLVLPIGPTGNNAPWTGKNGKNSITPNDGILEKTVDNTFLNEDFITDIYYDTEKKKVSFDYNIITAYPTIKTTMKRAYLPDPKQRAFTLEWDEHPEAQSYALTIYYINDAGNKAYVGGYNETDVEKATQIMVPNLTTTQFGRKMHAYVRCISTLPSSEISNELVFTPNTDLDENGIINGVESITNDEAVFGGKGYIQAPEDAQIYNMAGMKVGKENLPAGIYVVRMGMKAIKVIVK